MKKDSNLEKAVGTRITWWAGVYEYHKEPISPPQSEAYARDVVQYTGDQLNQAWLIWRTQSMKAPMPLNLIEIIGKKMAIEDQAQLYAGNLMYCVSFYEKYSTCYPDAAEKWIKEHIGDIGLRVVQQLGGWKNIWDRSEKLVKEPEMNIGSWRKMFKALLESDSMEEAFALPGVAEARRFMTRLNTKELEGASASSAETEL